MPSRRKGNSSAKKKAAGGKKKSKKQQNDQAKLVETERTGMTTQSLEEIMGTLNGLKLNLGTPAKDSKEKACLKNGSDQEDSQKKMIEETFLLAQREAPTILRRNNYNRGKAVDELKELLARTSPSLHAETRADIAGEQVESSLRNLAEEALRYELERRALYALDLFDMDRSKAIEDVTELIGSDKLGMIVPKKFQQKDAQVKLAEEAVNVVFGAKMTQRRREKKKQKGQQKQKAAQNGADQSGKPKSHTVGDLSGGWFGDDDYAAVSSEGDISEAQNAMMLEEALRAELKGKAYGVLARCGIDRSKAVEEMKRVVVKVARDVAPAKVLPEDETLRLAEDAVNAAVKAVQDDGNSRLAQEIRKEQEIQQQRPGAYSVENEAMSILRRNEMEQEKSLKELKGLLAQNSPMMTDLDRTVFAEQAIDEAIRDLADSIADDKALFEEESLRLNGSSSLSEDDMREELKGFAYLALRKCNMNRAKAVEMVIEMSEKDPSHEATTKLLQEGKKLKLAEDAVDAIFDIVLEQRRNGATMGSGIIQAPGPLEDEDESGLPELAKNWFATNHRVHPPIGDALTDDAWCRLAISEMEVEKPEGYKIKEDLSGETFDIYYTAAYVDPSDDFIYYAEQGEGARLNPTTGVWWYESEEAAKVAVKRVVAAAQKSRRDTAADDGSCSDISDSGDELLWELCAHLPLTTNRMCDTCGRRAVATWVEHGSKGNALAQCLTCQTFRFMYSYEGPYREWPSGTEWFHSSASLDFADFAELLLARVSDFDPRSVGDTTECVQCGDTAKPAREDVVVVLRPCCGNMVCVECAKPLKDCFGRSEVSKFGGAFS